MLDVDYILKHKPIFYFLQRGPYFSGVRNLKCFMPIHHAVMSRACPRNAIETLYRDMPACLTAETENGSLPIHLACQYSSDRSMIALLLNYNRYDLKLS